MEVAAVTALDGWLIQFNSIIQELGNNYIRAGAAWKDYPQRVAALLATQEDLVKNLGTYDIREESLASFLRIVHGADMILQQEVEKLKKRKGRRRMWYSIRGTYFSASVNTSIETAEGAYKRITDYLDTKQRTDNGVKAIAESQGPWLRISPDPRYVHRYDLEEEIMSALDKTEPDGASSAGAQQHSRVVLLWGASGYGKSTVAREVSLKCQGERSKFTKVVFLECGPGVTIPAKKIELLQMLGGGDIQSEIQDVNSKLTVHLRNPRLLIVLDDLSAPDLLLNLQNLSASGLGSGAQYLVTAQKEDFFLGFRPKSIPIGDLERSDAKKVLASHAGFEDQIIPKRWQNTANQIVDRIGTSPLMLTTLGVQIQRLGRQKRESWKQVSEDVFKYAQGDGTTLHMHGVQYSKQILSMMTSVFDGLGEEQKLLFALMAMWRGLSISEYALRFLYITAIAQGGFVTSFMESINDLKRTGFVVEKVEGNLSMHSSVKAFIWEYHKHKMEAVEKLLKDRQVEARVEDALQTGSQNPTCQVAEEKVAQDHIKKAVVYLHIDTSFSKDARRQADDDASSDQSMCANTQASWATVDIKRTASEPLMQLLVPEANPDNEVTEDYTGRTKEFTLYSYQVLLDFVNEDRLHHDIISKLLASESSILPVLTFLNNVCLLEDSFWENNAFEHASSIPSSMLSILQDGSRAQHHAAITEALYRLSGRWKENCETIAKVSGMIPQVADALVRDQDACLQASAAMALSAIAYWRNKTDDATTRTILELPGLLHTLVDLLCKDEAPLVQSAVAYALANLTFCSEAFYSLVTKSSMKSQFVLWDGLLDGLTMSLTRDDVPALQVSSALAVGNLATTGNIRRTVNQLGLLDNLVKSLYKDQNPRLQAGSASAIASMFNRCEDDTIRGQIVMWQGLLDGLAESLMKSHNPSLQKEAANAIYRFAFRVDAMSSRTLVTHASLMGNIVKLLHECRSSAVQLKVARALQELTLYVMDDRVKAKIVNFPKLLDGLIGLLVKASNSALQIHAAIIIFRCSGWDLHITDKIRNESGLVDSLVKLLGEGQNPNTQNNVNTLLHKLAMEHVVGDKSGLLVVIAKSLLTAQSADVQIDILETIKMVLEVSDNVVFRQLSQALLNFPEIVDRLVELLGAREELEVQAWAALILAFLANSGGDNLRGKIISMPHLLEGLSQSLVLPGAVNVAFLATLLAELALTKDKRIVDSVCSSANLVENLATSLTKYENLDCQISAARALLNLAGGNDQAWGWNLSRLVELLKRLREALLQGKNAALRERVSMALTSMPEGGLNDRSPIDTVAKEGAMKESGGTNRNRAGMIRKGLRKCFSSLRNTKDKVSTRRGNGVDTRVLLMDFLIGLTAL